MHLSCNKSPYILILFCVINSNLRLVITHITFYFATNFMTHSIIGGPMTVESIDYEITKNQNNIAIHTAALKKIPKLPDGKIVCTRNGKYVRAFLSNKGLLTYIKRKDRHIACGLASKMFHELRIKELTSQNLQFIKMRDELEKHGGSEALLAPDSAYMPYILGNLKNNDSSNWQSANFEHNPNHLDALKHKTKAGHLVRSKSEQFIANTLFENNIPYRYECALTLNGYTFYPDFTILCPRSGNVIYWEHFGMVDNPEYMRKTIDKISLFTTCGYNPNESLLMTFESGSSPLDPDDVYHMVRKIKNM